jgi:hypothetical protein
MLFASLCHVTHASCHWRVAVLAGWPRAEGQPQQQRLDACFSLQLLLRWLRALEQRARVFN